MHYTVLDCTYAQIEGRAYRLNVDMQCLLFYWSSSSACVCALFCFHFPIVNVRSNCAIAVILMSVDYHWLPTHATIQLLFRVLFLLFFLFFCISDSCSMWSMYCRWSICPYDVRWGSNCEGNWVNVPWRTSSSQSIHVHTYIRYVHAVVPLMYMCL